MSATTSPGLSALLERLDALDDAGATLDAVAACLGEAEITDADLAPYLNFSEARYERNLVRRCERFDVLVLCWEPGQATPVHNHSGQRGWVRVLRGALEETAYRPLSRIPGEGDACAQLMSVQLEQVSQAVVHAGPGVVTVDAERGIHRLANPGPGRAVSLHAYSKPHDSYLVFDLETGRVSRRELQSS